MALADWQRGLAALITAAEPGPPAPADSGLSKRERDWLTATAADRGLHVTRDVQRSWRRNRLRAALPLTMAALNPDQRPALVAAYLDACPCVSFFHVHEGRRFRDFLAAGPPPAPHIFAIAALEIAVHDAEEWLVFAGDAEQPGECPDDLLLRLHPGATRVRFDAPPEHVLAAVLIGSELPPCDQRRHEMIVAPGLPNFGRPLTDLEIELLDRCTAGATLRDLESAGPEARACARTLVRERALAPHPSTIVRALE